MLLYNCWIVCGPFLFFSLVTSSAFLHNPRHFFGFQNVRICSFSTTFYLRCLRHGVKVVALFLKENVDKSSRDRLGAGRVQVE